jgi:hypothetical protein
MVDGLEVSSFCDDIRRGLFFLQHDGGCFREETSRVGVGKGCRFMKLHRFSLDGLNFENATQPGERPRQRTKTTDLSNLMTNFVFVDGVVIVMMQVSVEVRE